MTDRNPLLDPLRALVEEWQRRGVSGDFVPAARDTWMQAAQELRATYLGYRQAADSEPVTVEPDDLLDAADAALNKHDLLGAAVHLLGWRISGHVGPSGGFAAMARWESITQRFLMMAETTATAQT